MKKATIERAAFFDVLAGDSVSEVARRYNVPAQTMHKRFLRWCYRYNPQAFDDYREHRITGKGFFPPVAWIVAHAQQLGLPTDE